MSFNIAFGARAVTKEAEDFVLEEFRKFLSSIKEHLDPAIAIGARGSFEHSNGGVITPAEEATPTEPPKEDDNGSPS